MSNCSTEHRSQNKICLQGVQSERCARREDAYIVGHKDKHQEEGHEDTRTIETGTQYPRRRRHGKTAYI
jgi:hypothetical protein